MAWFGDFIDWYHDNGLIPGLWKGITGQQSNETINEENLEYQKERNAIEDARYEEETAYQRSLDDYNKAFAENERDYQRQFAENQRDYERALQQQIFDREDTALQRQASALSAMGINPASQQLNGLGAGQAVSASGVNSSSSNISTSTSSRGGSALHQDMTGVNSVSALLGLADTMNGLQTGKYQRDALALQNDAKFLDNLDKANTLGINYKGLFNPNKEGGYINFSKKYQMDFIDNEGKSLYDTPEYKQGAYTKYKKEYFENAPDWAKTLEAIGDDNIYNKATKALTNLSQLADKASTNLFDKVNGKTMYELGMSKNGKWNPFEMLLNIFR